MRPAFLTTERLELVRLELSDAAAFQTLATDAHIRRYLLDGETVPEGWAEDELALSDETFEEFGIGLGLVYETGEREHAIGFAGFKVFDDLQPDPQLLYALLEPFTGRGYATELTLGLIEHVRSEHGFGTVFSAVDEPNTASLRVLEKCGFHRWGLVVGAFGEILLMSLPGAPR